jgi:unsaturated chondroitin disaccharide hydrolase
VSDSSWITGFFPGAMWLIYQYSGDTNYRTWAEEWMGAIAPEQYSTNTDDVGFMINTSYGNAYRLTGNPAYKAVVLQAAQSFSNRFNAAVGCLADDTFLSPPQFQVVIDVMMNTELLYNAHDLGGSSNLYNDALSHAGRTITNQIRADGSTYQEVIYNSYTGAVISLGNRSTIPALDTWARGHAWGIHAFTMVFQQTGDPRFLGAAEQTADFYIKQVPSDYVPYWYFQTNGSPPDPPLRDSSAASITLSGLVQLSQLETNATNAGKFWQEALNIFRSLSSTNYLAEGTESSGILLHGDSTDTPTDCSLIYGDYYFIEALTRLNQLYGQTSLTYLPDTNFYGTDTFTYQACDSSGASSSATVSVMVGLAVPNPTIAVSSAGFASILFPTSAGSSYFVQYANGLTAPVSWNVLATNIAGTGSACSITDTNIVAQRFYRVGLHF